MTKINASDLPPPDSIAPACAKHYKPLSKKKKRPIDTEAIGTPAYNVLLDLMKCQVKHPNISGGDDGESGVGGSAKRCVKAEKRYAACHAAVMGVGNYNGRKHCGEEMERLYACNNPKCSIQ